MTATPRRSAALTRDDIEQFYRDGFVREEAGLIAVGDITMDELTSELEKVLGGWKSAAGSRPATDFRRCRRPQPTRLVLVDKPGAAQSVISVALPGADRKSPDYFPLAGDERAFSAGSSPAG